MPEHLLQNFKHFNDKIMNNKNEFWLPQGKIWLDIKFLTKNFKYRTSKPDLS